MSEGDAPLRMDIWGRKERLRYRDYPIVEENFISWVLFYRQKDDHSSPIEQFLRRTLGPSHLIIDTDQITVVDSERYQKPRWAKRVTKRWMNGKPCIDARRHRHESGEDHGVDAHWPHTPFWK